MSVSMWILWAVMLIVQNLSFTFVSRARNSGSLARHVKAAIFSNGVWFFTQIFAVKAFMDILTGKSGWGVAAFAGLFYTVFTVGGSIAAHYIALATEKGKTAVGASAKYAQIPKEDWEKVYNAFRKSVVTVGDEGTLTVNELVNLKAIANGATAESLFPTPQIDVIPPAAPAQGMKL